MQEQHLIRSTGHLHDEHGRLREPGWAPRPPFDYERSRIAAPRLRIKEWDYYLVEDQDYAVALTFSDLGYLGLVSASVMDFRARTFRTTSDVVTMPLGSMGLPASSETGDVAWENGRCWISYSHVPAGRRLSFSMARFEGRDDLECEFLLTDEPRDSMVVCIPWAKDEAAFYYNRKVLGMRARGAFRRGALVHEFDPAGTGGSGAAFGLLDWGRGVWTYDNTWYWAAAQGLQRDRDGREHVVCLNLGYGFGDVSAASENAIFVDGVCHKLGRVDFGIPRGSDGYAYLSSWHMVDEDGRLDLVFDPEIDRTDSIDVAGLISTRQHQVFGRLRGTLVLDGGEELDVRGLRCSAEHIRNRY